MSSIKRANISELVCGVFAIIDQCLHERARSASEVLRSSLAPDMRAMSVSQGSPNLSPYVNAITYCLEVIAYVIT